MNIAATATPPALDYRHLRRLARRHKPMPVSPVEGMATVLRHVESERRRGRRVPMDNARLASIYAIEFLALVGLHLPVSIDRKFYKVLDQLEQFAVGTCPGGAL